MGNTNSSAVQKCLESAVGAGNVATNSTFAYQLSHVKAYNLDIPVNPAAVTYPSTSEEVAAIVKCAVDNNLKVQPRCGGHSYANYGLGGSDNGIVVDMKNFQQFSMDNSTWQATIGGGTLLRDVTKRLHDNGNRAIAHGTCPQVGIGGHATIGGLGPTSRMWGTTLDHIESATIILSNSTIIRASATQNADIFWALKGAGASFGIITEFEMRTQPEPGQTVLYSYSINAGNASVKAEAFKQWQALIADAELSWKFASQFIITELGLVVTGTFFGSKEEFDGLNISGRLPQKEEEDVIVLDDWLGVVSHWAEDVALEVVGGISSNFYAKSAAYTRNDTLDDETVDELFAYVEETDKGTLAWFVIWDLEGGKTSEYASDATAYGHRDALFYHQTYAVNLLGKVDDTQRGFLEGFNEIVEKGLGRQLGAYAGYVDKALGEEGPERYWGGNLERLMQIKKVVDPGDVFKNPQSVGVGK